MEYILEASTELKTVMTVTHELTSVLSDLPVEAVASLCELTLEQATILKQITTLGHTITHVLDRTFVELREVISCETMNPVYTTFVHQALCTQAVTGMSWIFYTTLFIGIFSMVLLMTRAALYPVHDRALPTLGSNEDEIEVVKNADQTHLFHEMEGNDVVAIDKDNVEAPFENVPAHADEPERVDEPANVVDAPPKNSESADPGELS